MTKYKNLIIIFMILLSCMITTAFTKLYRIARLLTFEHNKFTKDIVDIQNMMRIISVLLITNLLLLLYLENNGLVKKYLDKRINH